MEPKCGHKKLELPLSMRVYQCDNHNCDWVADRDYSAAINLLGFAEPEFMSVEKQEPTLFDEAGTKKQAMSNIV
ncbi:MAG: zinc ribbon domain-containing protein [Cyanobacteria bacterium P01_D01_bin.116]